MLNSPKPLSTFGPDVFSRVMRTRASERGYEPLEPGEQEIVDRARLDINAFIEYCFRDERNRKLTQQWFHKEWQELASKQRRMILWAPIEHAKTKQLTIFRTLWILGHNPDALIAIISETARGKAYKFGQELRQHIQENIYLHRVFPNLRRGSIWRENEFTVERNIIDRNPSCQFLPAPGGSINGSRLTHVICDDILSYSNTYSRARRDKLLGWIEDECLSRMLPEEEVVDGDAIHRDSFLMVGTAWHREDAMHVFGERPRFSAHRYRAIHAEIKELRNPGPKTPDKILWPDMWPVKRLVDRLDDVGSASFSKTLLNEVRDESTSYFKEIWLDRALALGRGKVMQPSHTPKKSEKLCIGLDLAFGVDVKRHDLNVFAVLLYDGTDYRLLWVETDREKRWSLDQILEKIENYNDRYPGAEFRVESNLGQRLVTNEAQAKTKAKVTPVHTGKNKRDPTFGVQSMAVWMERGQFVLPSNENLTSDKEVDRLVNELLNFQPDDRHIPDRVAALWLAYSGLEKKRLPEGWKVTDKRPVGRPQEF